MHRLLTIWVY